MLEYTCECGWKVHYDADINTKCYNCHRNIKLIAIQSTNSTRTRQPVYMDLEALSEHWLLLHNFDLCPWDAYVVSRWYLEWLNSIPCPECKHHAKELVKKYPPVFRTSQDFFKWGVNFHNVVNDELHHDYFPLYLAQNIYRPNTPLSESFDSEGINKICEMEATCLHRSKAIGEVDCNCAGKLRIYNCNLYNIECMTQATKVEGINYFDGTHGDKFEGIQCQGCEGYSPLMDDLTEDWRYVKTEHLIQATRRLASKIQFLPRGIIAMPTSGALPASYLSTILNVPYYPSLRDYLNNSPSLVSVRSKKRVEGYGPAILIDDTIHSGRGMSIELPPEIKKAAVYALPSSRHKVDYWGELLHNPHILEWNLFNSGIIDGKYANNAFKDGCAIDFDGVLCFDPPVVYDERLEKRIEKYEQWIENAVPRYPIRNRVVPLIVTWRIEKYRAQTEAWLEKHGIKFKELIMWQGDAGSRHWKPSYKGEAYLNSSCGLFIESNAMQALQIHEYTHKPVLCLATGRIYKK